MCITYSTSRPLKHSWFPIIIQNIMKMKFPISFKLMLDVSCDDESPFTFCPSLPDQSSLSSRTWFKIKCWKCTVHLFWVIRALAVTQGHHSKLYEKIWKIYKLSESHYKYNILLKKSLYHTKHHKTSYCCPEKTDAGDLEYGQKTKSKYIYRKSYRLLKMKIIWTFYQNLFPISAVISCCANSVD